jgi:hypothetical protein
MYYQLLGASAEALHWPPRPTPDTTPTSSPALLSPAAPLLYQQPYSGYTLGIDTQGIQLPYPGYVRAAAQHHSSPHGDADPSPQVCAAAGSAPCPWRQVHAAPQTRLCALPRLCPLSSVPCALSSVI